LEPKVLAGALVMAALIWTIAAAVRSARLAGGSPPALPSGRVTTWAIHWIDLLGMVFFAALFCGLAIYGTMLPNDNRHIGAAEFAVTIVIQLIFAGSVLFIVGLRISPWRFFGLGWRQWPWALLFGPAAVVAMWFLLGSLEVAGYSKWMQDLLGKPTAQEMVQTLRETKDPVVELLLAVAAVIVAPLCEEAVFRGYIYPVAKRFGGRYAATAFSAVVFASAHGNLTALLPLAVFGVLLVLLYEWTGSLWAPISAHFFFNGATVLVQMLTKWHIIPDQLPT
jgi:membrane protease YdiL (CAAX protease family)